MPKASKRARGDDDEGGGGPATRTRRQRDITEHSEKPESEKQPEEKRCPICLEDWFNCDRGGPKIFQTCCGGRICGTCDEHIAEEHDDQTAYHVYMAGGEGDPRAYDFFGNFLFPQKCPLCRAPVAVTLATEERQLREHVERNSPAAIFELGRRMLEPYDEATPGSLRENSTWREGIEHVERAVRLGCVDAMLSLASWLDEERFGLRGDDSRGLALCRRASDLGSVAGHYALGCHLYYEVGKRQEGIEFLELAVSKGMHCAMVKLAFHYEREGQNRKGAELMYQAAKQGSALAMCEVGRMLEVGTYFKKDVVRAYRWFKKAKAAEPWLHMARAGVQRLAPLQPPPRPAAPAPRPVAPAPPPAAAAPRPTPAPRRPAAPAPRPAAAPRTPSAGDLPSFSNGGYCAIA